MAYIHPFKRLKKELSLLGVYALATGATMSTGFFLLPGIAAQEAGPALILCYMIAAVPLVPAIFSIVELSTAMPRAGGVYYFLDRSLGPLLGTIGGIGTWIALLLKVSFALVGLGAYISVFFSYLSITSLAVGMCLIFGMLNLLGAKKGGGFQVFIVFIILAALLGFVAGGLPQIKTAHFHDFFQVEASSIFSTAGMVCISYIGLTCVASLSEEVKNPERNFPLRIFLYFGTILFLYLLGSIVIVGVVPPEILSGNLTPVAAAASFLFGKWGVIVLSGAAIVAFTSVANAGTLAASRFPLAMGRDHLMPLFFQKLNPRGVPVYSVLVATGVVTLVLLVLDPTKIAKLASSFQLLIFALVNLAVIVMRESLIESYDPAYRAPFYPWMQISGIISPLWLIMQIGWLAIFFIGATSSLASVWYFYYGRPKVMRDGALYHVFARLARRRFEGLDQELRGILKEKGLRAEDPYQEVVARGFFLDLPGETTFEEIVKKASELLAARLSVDIKRLEDGFLQGTRLGATPVSKSAALPHLRVVGIPFPEMVMVRSQIGTHVKVEEGFWKEHTQHPIHALFFLVSPEGNPGQHLRMLAQIAERIDSESFMKDWLGAENEQKLREILLKEEYFISLRLHRNSPTAPLIGLMLREWTMHKGCLVALIRKGDGENIVPDGNTILREGDRLTIIGKPEGIGRLRDQYGELKKL